MDEHESTPSDEAPQLDILDYLWSALDTFDTDLSAEYGPPAKGDEALDAELTAFSERISQVLYSPPALRKLLNDIPASAPWDKAQHRLFNLIEYRYVHEHAESAVARAVVSRLDGVRERVRHAFLALLLLIESAPTDTALKYLKQVLDLYLAGYTVEVTVMCGAVLEASMRDRIPDLELKERRIRPAFKRTNDFSLAQRMKVEQELNILDDRFRSMFWEVVNARNDAVHVQPDIGPDPATTLLRTAGLLGEIHPVGETEDR